MKPQRRPLSLSLLPLALCAAGFIASCRATRSLQAVQTQTQRTDTAHLFRLLTTSADSTATLTLIALDTLELWLAAPPAANSPAATTELAPAFISAHKTAAHPAATADSPAALRIKARGLRLVRATTAATATVRDSLHLSRQTAAASSSAEERQGNPASPSPRKLLFCLIAAVFIIAACVYLLLRRR